MDYSKIPLHMDVLQNFSYSVNNYLPPRWFNEGCLQMLRRVRQSERGKMWRTLEY